MKVDVKIDTTPSGKVVLSDRQVTIMRCAYLGTIQESSTGAFGQWIYYVEDAEISDLIAMGYLEQAISVKGIDLIGYRITNKGVSFVEELMDADNELKLENEYVESNSDLFTFKMPNKFRVKEIILTLGCEHSEENVTLSVADGECGSETTLIMGERIEINKELGDTLFDMMRCLWEQIKKHNQG